MNLLSNIISNYSYLRDDFLGLSVSLTGIGQFVLHIVITLGVFILFYFFGEKIRKLLFKEVKQYIFFINIALGYITLGTGLGLLGGFSLLYPTIIVAYLFFVGLLEFYPFSWKKFNSGTVRRLFLNILPGRSFFVVAVLLFILIAFLRLINPEIVEDGYHTDNAITFLKTHTTMYPSHDNLHTIPFPQLPEMIYTIPILAGDKEAARFIHFGFYILIVALLFSVVRSKQHSFANLLPFFFVTSPVVIRNSPTQYTDFFAIFTFLLSTFVIQKDMSKKQILLSGLLFGAVVSAKVWMFIYLPVLLIYTLVLNWELSFKKCISIVTVFISGYLLVSSLWYIRAYFLSGNPIFPLINTIFIKSLPYEVNPIPFIQTKEYMGLNLQMLYPENLVALSPFFFLGVVSLFFLQRKHIYSLIKKPIFVLFVIFTLEQFFIPVFWGRYLVMWMLITTIFLSSGIAILYKNNSFYRYGVITAFIIFFSYYFVNTLLILPYGFGWANRNSYLTRVLGRDNVSYYDFNENFQKWITTKDLVAMFGMGSFYYADFRYIDVGYVLKGRGDSFDTFRQKGVTKLMIKGGDINWFCKELRLRDCKAERVTLLASYPDYKKYNLYLIQY